MHGQPNFLQEFAVDLSRCHTENRPCIVAESCLVPNPTQPDNPPRHSLRHDAEARPTPFGTFHLTPPPPPVRNPGLPATTTPGTLQAPLNPVPLPYAPWPIQTPCHRRRGPSAQESGRELDLPLRGGSFSLVARHRMRTSSPATCRAPITTLCSGRAQPEPFLERFSPGRTLS
jgi:hypothetical protein